MLDSAKWRYIIWLALTENECQKGYKDMNRSDKILKLIVEEFIKTASPVSSKSLIDTFSLDLSSATIRSEMNALEKAGYLEKTHISSGRVPSSKGYRYYIDNLREKSVDEEFKYNLQTILEQKVQSIDKVIKESCEILAQMTSLASIVLGPNALEEVLVSIQFVPLSKTSATAVFITDQGYVENKTFVIGKDTKMSDVESCIRLLNERLKGTKIHELVEKMELIKPLLKDYVVDHDVLYQAILEAFVGFARDRLKTYGQESLFDQPEFSKDAEKIKKMLELLDKPQIFRQVSELSDKDISVHIGGESTQDNNVSIVTAKVNLPNDKSESIAIVGPKRMDYDRALSAMEYLVSRLEEHFKTKKDDKSKSVNNNKKGKSTSGQRKERKQNPKQKEGN